MKLSVATYRASTERLTTLRQVCYGTLNKAAAKEEHEAQRRRGVSLESAANLLGSVGENLGLGSEKHDNFVAPRSATAIGLAQEYESSVRFTGGGGPSRAEPWVRAAGSGSGKGGRVRNSSSSSSQVNLPSGQRSGVMMVDGSPRRIVNPQTESDNTGASNNNNAGQERKNPPVTAEPDSTSPTQSGGCNALGTVLLIPGVGNNPNDGKGNSASGSVVGTDASSTARSSRSRWLKLRTTVQLSGAMTQVHKKPPLKREDSFLKRFSTRHVADPCSIDGSSRRGDNAKGAFFGTWRSVVNPDENILFWWLSLLTLCLLYNAWTIIARQAFPELQRNISPTWYAADGFSDIIFILDIAFQFRTGYLEQGLMVYESKKLAGHYFKSRSFLMDIVAVTPLDLLQIWVGILPLIRFPRFLKVYRSFRFYYMVESRTIYPNLWRVVNLIHILLLLAHWFGCFYYMLSELEGFDGQWSYPKPVGDYATLPRKYLGSVYWSTLTLTTIGDLATPATNLQYSFTIISYLIGVFIFATIVGQVGNVITNRNASRLEFERLLDGAKLYMRHHKVPRNMQRRVQRWYDYSWSRGRMQGGGDINSALGILPDKLKTELALHVNLKTLKKVSIFQECQPEFLHDLVLKMKAYIFTPGDLICRKGEVAREMFIIADGVLEVISETGKVLTQMKAGDFFGEIGILNLDGFNRRTADVRSVGYSELFSLSREDILTAMKDYPEAQEILQTMGRKRLMEARLAANMSKNPKEETQGSKRGPGGITMESGKRIATAQKPRTAVRRIKEDVRSLKKLLRSRSTPTGKACLSGSDETVEMKPMRASPAFDQNLSDESKSPRSRRKASLKTLMKKIHLKGESPASPGTKGLRNRLSSIRSKFRDSGQSCSITSRTDSSASVPTSVDSGDSNSHLNKALPLLQRIRLLGEQEKAAGVKTGVVKKQQPSAAPSTIANSTLALPSGSTDAPHEVIGEGLPLLERLKLLRVREQAQASTTATTSTPESPPALLKTKLQSAIPKENLKTQVPSNAASKRAPSLTTRIASVIGGRSGSLSKANVQEPRTPLPPPTPRTDTRPTDFTPELPLLKKVLLMKMMEDKKITSTTLQSENKDDSKMQPALVVKEDHPAPATKTLKTEPATKVEQDNIQRKTKPAFDAGRAATNVSTIVTEAPKSTIIQSIELPSSMVASKISAPASSSKVSNAQRPPLDKSKSEEVSTTNIVTEIEEAKAPTIRVRKDSTTAELLRSNTIEGYSARKAKLSRMMALREDSDEHGSELSSGDDDMDVSSDDPFVKNIECQTEVPRSTSTSPDTWSPRQPSRKLRPDEVPGMERKAKRSAKSTIPDAPDGKKRRSFKRKDSSDGLSLSNDGIQNYLVKVMKNVKHVVKSYVIEQQQELQNRVVALEREIREKDVLIKQLEAGILTKKRSGATAMTSSTFDEVSSLDVSSISSSDTEEGNIFSRERHNKSSIPKNRNISKRNPDTQEATADNEDEEDDILCPEEEALLQRNRPMSQRKSWTYGGTNGELTRARLRRKVLLNSKQSYSLDDEKCQASISPCREQELWKLEFSIPENPMSSTEIDDSTVQHFTDEDVAELIVSLPEESEVFDKIVEQSDAVSNVIEEDIQHEDDFEIDSEATDSNDWELQMLVQQFEKNIRQKRRHSSGEILSWQAVLGQQLASNTTVLPKSPDSPKPPSRGSRKFSLVENRIPQYWDIPQKTSLQHKSMWQLPQSTSRPENDNNTTFATTAKTKLSLGENNGTVASNTTQNSNKLDKKTLTRRKAFRHRRQNSYTEFQPHQHPRKASLPTADSLYSVSVSKWIGAENSSLTKVSQSATVATNSSTANKIKVKNIDPRFGSLEDVSTTTLHRRHPWPRSPSSPNVSTDQHFWDSSTMVSEHCIPEWPSSPCLPTITEDDHSICPSLTSSPCRSFSHDCIPSLPPSPLWQAPWNSPMSAGFWTTDHDSLQSESPQSCSRKDTASTSRQSAKEKQQLPVRSPTDTRTTLKELKSADSRVIPFAQSREDSVVIAIPECEPLLSPR